jgi:hypothetical protein
MQVTQRKKVYDYFYKTAIYLFLLFIIYNIIMILFFSRYKEKKRWPRILNVVNNVEYNLKHAKPTKSVVDKSIDSGSPLAGPIKKASIFTGPEGDEEQIKKYVRVDIKDATKIDFKGITGGLVLINVRRKIGEQWYEQGFPIKAGEQIGAEKIIGSKKVNFTTNCILQDITGEAQRPVTLMKKVAILGEEGEFVGTRMVPGETFMKSTPKIAYKDEQGSTKELWLGETAVIIKEPPKEDEKWYKDPVGKVKSKYKDVTKTSKTPTTDESAVKDVKE